MTLAVAALAIWAVANLWLVKVDLAALPSSRWHWASPALRQS